MPWDSQPRLACGPLDGPVSRVGRAWGQLSPQRALGFFNSHSCQIFSDLDDDIVSVDRIGLRTGSGDCHMQVPTVLDADVVGEKAKFSRLLVEAGNHVLVVRILPSKLTGNLCRTSPLNGWSKDCTSIRVSQIVGESCGGILVGRCAGSLLRGVRELFLCKVADELEASVVIGWVSIPFQKAVAVVKEVERIIRGMQIKSHLTKN